MKKMMLILGLIFTTQIAMAKYTTQDKIAWIYVYQNDALIRLPNKIENSCQNKDYLLIQDINGKGKAQFATLLSAYQGENKIKIGYSPAKCDDIWGQNAIAVIYNVGLVR